MSASTFDNIRLDWVAGTFAILVGLTMSYVPWEFGAPAFVHIYPYLSWLGAGFLLWGTLLVSSALYPSWPRAVFWLGRAGFLLTLAFYWWKVAVLSAGPTGTIVYPLMALGLLAESSPWLRGRSAFPPFVAAVALGFGVGMFLVPSSFLAGIYSHAQGVLLLVGSFYLVASALLFHGLVRRRRWSVSTGAGLLALLFAHGAWGAFHGRTWIGFELYGILAIGSGVLAFPYALPRTTSLSFRLLRVLAVACVLPLLALGAIATTIAQRAIGEQVRVNASQAVEGEAQELSNRLRAVKGTLRVNASHSVIPELLLARDAEALQGRLEQVVESTPGVNVLFVLDAKGERIAGGPGQRLTGNFADRDYFQQAMASPDVFVSPPLLGRGGNPLVVLSTRIEHEGEVIGMLGGVMLLESLNRETTVASSRYDVEVVDTRDLGVIRQSGAHAAGIQKSRYAAALIRGAEGTSEQFSPDGRLRLLALAEVPGSSWKVVVAVPLQAAYAPLVRFSLAVIGLALLACLVAVVLARFGARRLISELERLRRTFSKVTSVDGAKPDGQTDELVALDQAFQSMAADIERQRGELQAAVATREEFLSLASHELRTPLSVLKMTLAAMERLPEEVPPSHRRAVERMQKQVGRLSRLVAELLDVSRLQSGRFSLEREPCEAVGLLRDIVERIRIAHPTQAARLNVEAPERTVTASWDEHRVEQLVSNLVENAFRYSPGLEPVTVLVEVLEGKGRVKLSVRDQGIGIGAEHLPRLFKSFYRAPNASVAHAGGLGLGLVISREIVERHGGELRVESAGENQGACFTFELPVTGVDEARVVR